MNKNGNNDFETFVEKLKSQGLIPKDTKLIEKISNEDINKFRVIEATIKDIRIRLSPPVVFEKSIGPDEIGEYERGIFFNMKKITISLREGFIYKSGGGIKPYESHIEEFNNAIALFNIVGIPFDFIKKYELEVLAENKAKQDFSIIFSESGNRRGLGFKPIDISIKEQDHISFTLAIIYHQIEVSGILDLGDIYIFLGYCNYYLFHENFLFSFLNGWMFIEAIIELLWGKNIEKINKKIIKNREWTIYIKIEVLFMLNIIDEKLRNKLNELRKKRNNVFHVDTKIEKRRVKRKDASNCFIIGCKLLNLVMGWDVEKIIYFNDIRNKFYIQLHKGNFYSKKKRK